MNTTTKLADNLAVILRERTPGSGHRGCDAFDPCASCRTARHAQRALRVPEQRRRPF